MRQIASYEFDKAKKSAEFGKKIVDKRIIPRSLFEASKRTKERAKEIYKDDADAFEVIDCSIHTMKYY